MSVLMVRHHTFDAKPSMISWKSDSGVERHPHYKAWLTVGEFSIMRQKASRASFQIDTVMEAVSSYEEESKVVADASGLQI